MTLDRDGQNGYCTVANKYTIGTEVRYVSDKRQDVHS